MTSQIPAPQKKSYAWNKTLKFRIPNTTGIEIPGAPRSGFLVEEVEIKKYLMSGEPIDPQVGLQCVLMVAYEAIKSIERIDTLLDDVDSRLKKIEAELLETKKLLDLP